MSNKTKRITIRVTEEDLKRLKKLAKRDKVTISECIRGMLEFQFKVVPNLEYME